MDNASEAIQHKIGKKDPLRFSSYLAVGLLSAATLTYEINLTRLFSVAQFYHFAYLVVSLALLGFGASGTVLSMWPRWGGEHSNRTIVRWALASGLSMLGGYLFVNWLPFDSFSIAWDVRQLALLALNYLVLAIPFFFSGAVVGRLLSDHPGKAGRTYAANLIGSAIGCVIALLAPTAFGAEGTVVLSAALAGCASLLASISPSLQNRTRRHTVRFSKSAWAAMAIAIVLVLTSLVDLGTRVVNASGLGILTLQISPYKSLSYALQYPGAELISQQWNEFSRVDVVKSQGVRSLPGLSYLFPHTPPSEYGLLIDGDDLSPVVRANEDMRFVEYMPASIVYQLRPGANTLILQPRGGLDILIADEMGASMITAVEENELIVENAAHIYSRPDVHTVIDSDRSYIQRCHAYACSDLDYDVIVLSLNNSYRPVRSGAYSLAEDYRYSVQTTSAAMDILDPEGILILSRWLQTPPSEWLRAFTTAVNAIDERGGNPHRQILAFRTYNLGILLIKGSAFTPAERDQIRAFAVDRAYDMVYGEGIAADEVNRFNVYPEPVYFKLFNEYVAASSREAWIDDYPFETEPPTDDRPFFGHFFKWSQVDELIAELGKTWQPFGGAGYFVLFASLALTLLLAFLLIWLPVGIRFRLKPTASSANRSKTLLYFGGIGLAFLLVEIPLIQKLILYLGNPAYALTAVLFTLLLFSGIGSQTAHRLPHRISLFILSGVAILILFLLDYVVETTLGLPLSIRFVITILVLSPLGFLMGLPFPKGIAHLHEDAPQLIAWAWAVNGATSVVSSSIAALLAITFGFRLVVIIGAICYLSAGITLAHWKRSTPPRHRESAGQN